MDCSFSEEHLKTYLKYQDYLKKDYDKNLEL